MEACKDRTEIAMRMMEKMKQRTLRVTVKMSKSLFLPLQAHNIPKIKKITEHHIPVPRREKMPPKLSDCSPCRTSITPVTKLTRPDTKDMTCTIFIFTVFGFIISSRHVSGVAATAAVWADTLVMVRLPATGYWL